MTVPWAEEPEGLMVHLYLYHSLHWVSLPRVQSSVGVFLVTMHHWPRAGGKRHLLQLPLEQIPVKIGSSNQVLAITIASTAVLTTIIFLIAFTASHQVNVSTGVLDRVEARGVGFSELQSYWSLHLHLHLHLHLQ